MHVLEDAVPIGACDLVDGIDRALCIVRSEHAPGSEQRADEVVHLADRGLAELRLRILVLLLLERAHAEDEVGDPVVAVELDEPVGEPRRLIDLTIGKERIERLLEQFRIALIGAQRRAVIGCRRIGVAIHVGLLGRKIATCGCVPHGVARVLSLRHGGGRQHPQRGGCDCE